MNDLQRALADISNIRQHIAGNGLFKGFGPQVIAFTGVLAIGTALSQAWMPAAQAASVLRYFATWICLAAVCVILIGGEMWLRTRRHHGDLANAMMINAVEAFLPSGAAGAALGLVVIVYAPESSWLLPGLWQLVLSLGVFAAIRFLPRPVTIVAAWYFLAGIASLIHGSTTQLLDPWVMGIPFGVGQILLACILRYTVKDGGR